jgi:NAD(P)-dependent dehydrogenase (short-subunit alcohol dehydrogenase family)
MNDTERSFRLDHKVALVSGAARGLGRSIVQALADVGATVIVTARKLGDAELVAKEVCAAGGRAFGLQLDVTKESDWDSVVSEVVKEFGSLDILVNNAGIEKMALLTDMSLADFTRIQATNVEGTFLGMKYAIKAMKPDGIAGRGGAIVNIASLSGMVGFVAAAGYAASKGAVRGMTKVAATECALLGYGIRVNSIHPGVFDSEMLENLLGEYVELGLAPSLDEARKHCEKLGPLGIGLQRNVANAVVYLASDASAWITGIEHVVDGGAVSCR